MVFTTGKNYYRKKSTVVWPAIFFGGFELQAEKITTGIKSTVIWPMEAAQIWRELNTNSNNYGTILTTGRKILPEKKGTVIWPAIFFSGFKLQPEKLRQKKKVQSSGRWRRLRFGGN
jgi:hypothetical protein